MPSSLWFDRLEAILTDWYSARPEEFALPDKIVPAHIHPVLREFYLRFGRLAEPDTRFRHPGSDFGPFNAQDEIAPVGKLRAETGVTLFGFENQGNFAIGASLNPDILDARSDACYLAIDARENDEAYPGTGVPLDECLFTMSLQETVMSALDRFEASLPLPKDEADAFIKAVTRKIASCYVWPQEPLVFFIGPEGMGTGYGAGKVDFLAPRDVWRLAPSDPVLKNLKQAASKNGRTMLSELAERLKSQTFP